MQRTLSTVTQVMSGEDPRSAADPLLLPTHPHLHALLGPESSSPQRSELISVSSSLTTKTQSCPQKYLESFI